MPAPNRAEAAGGRRSRRWECLCRPRLSLPPQRHRSGAHPPGGPRPITSSSASTTTSATPRSPAPSSATLVQAEGKPGTSTGAGKSYPLRPAVPHNPRFRLSRTEEHLIRDQVKFRVGRIVYVAISPDETIIGFGFPQEERAVLIAAEPARFFLHRPSDQRYNWIDVRMALLGPAEMREFVTEAWCMVVPKGVAPAHLGRFPGAPARTNNHPRHCGPPGTPQNRGPAPSTLRQMVRLDGCGTGFARRAWPIPDWGGRGQPPPSAGRDTGRHGRYGPGLVRHPH